MGLQHDTVFSYYSVLATKPDDYSRSRQALLQNYHQPELDDRTPSRTLTRVTIRKSILKEDLGDHDNTEWLLDGVQLTNTTDHRYGEGRRKLKGFWVIVCYDVMFAAILYWTDGHGSHSSVRLSHLLLQ